MFDARMCCGVCMCARAFFIRSIMYAFAENAIKCVTQITVNNIMILM